MASMQTVSNKKRGSKRALREGEATRVTELVSGDQERKLMSGHVHKAKKRIQIC